MKRPIIVLLLAVMLGLAAVAGWYWRAPVKTAAPAPPALISGIVQDKSGRPVLYWYDPMTPGQKFERPGKSPFMDMPLVPKYADEEPAQKGSDTGGVSIPAQTLQNLGMRLAKVELAKFGDALSVVGRIEADEHRFYAVQTRTPGFVERLAVRAVGDRVAKGQKLAEIYAPELLAAQQEYLALLRLDQVPDADTLRQAARSRLQLLGMSEAELALLTQQRQASPRFGVYAPASGVLTELGVREGGQIVPGSSLMQIADMSAVWLIAEVPERDAQRLKPGLLAEARLESLPGNIFKGHVDYLYPVLDATSRTLRVRIALANADGRLRPGMYANVSLAGQSHEALSVPSESVIATGTRKVVIARHAQGFRPVEIVTGQEMYGRTEILRGLSGGESVVASGQFLIDSEASLSGVLARLQLPPQGARP